MLLRSCAIGLVCCLVAGCSGPVGRNAPFGPSARAQPNTPSHSAYVWARNDGQRMSNNPALLRQGQKDQAACREEAGRISGVLNQSVFSHCMQKRGYSARPAG